MKPENPYKPGSKIWAIFEGDWEDLTVTQIAEVLGCSRSTVSCGLSRIKRETGYIVPRAIGELGRPCGYRCPDCPKMAQNVTHKKEAEIGDFGHLKK